MPDHAPAEGKPASDAHTEGDAHTEAPDGPGEASPVPPLFFWTLWVGAFFVVLWGMMLLFGRRPGVPHHPRPPEGEGPGEPPEPPRGP